MSQRHIHTSFQFDWYKFVFGVMNLDDVKITITDKEPIVVRSVTYFQKLFGLLQKYLKRYKAA